MRNVEEKEVGSYLSYREVSDGVVRATKGRIDVYAVDPLRMPGYGRKRGAR